MYNATKDPAGDLDYSIDYTNWLVGDAIATSTWTAIPTITLHSPSATTTVATTWVSGGIVGNVYVVTNRITSTNSRTDERSIEIEIENK